MIYFSIVFLFLRAFAHIKADKYDQVAIESLHRVRNIPGLIHLVKGNSTRRFENLPFSPNLLDQITHILPGSGNVDAIEKELQNMLFGQRYSTTETTTKGSKKVSMTMTTMTTATTTTTTTTASLPDIVVDGDRANYENYDYRDYDMYDNYEDDDDDDKDEEDESEIKIDLVKMESKNRLKFLEATENGIKSPIAAEQRQFRRPSLGKRRRRTRPGSNRGRTGAIKGGDRLIPLPETVRIHRPQTQTKDSFEPSPVFGGDFRSQSFLTSRSDDCDYFTEDICINVRHYPRDKIMSLLSRNRRIGQDLVADVADQSADNLIDGVSAVQESQYTFAHYYGNRRQDGNQGYRDFAQEGGFLCPSEIKYAKPKRGKTASGVWKDIVNVADYTQTLRMEKCLKPGGSCSYVSHHYKSQCSQVYNYHRLLSWSEKRGLHMDIYKVPTCCSCHIMGYAYVYPPLGKEKYPQSPLPKREVVDEFGFKPPAEFNNFLNKFPNPFRGSKRGPGTAASVASQPHITIKKRQQQEAPPPSRLRPLLRRPQPISSKMVPPPPPPPPPPQGRRPPPQPRRPGSPPPHPQSSATNRPLPPPVRNPPRRRMSVQESRRPNKYVERGGESRELPPLTKPNQQPLVVVNDINPEMTIGDDDNNKEEKAKEDEMESTSSSSSSSSSKSSSSQNERKNVNYGYHPIIDFFERYRFSATK